MPTSKQLATTLCFLFLYCEESDYDDIGDDELIDNEEYALPKPEPLGGTMVQTRKPAVKTVATVPVMSIKQNSTSISPPPSPSLSAIHSHQFAYEKSRFEPPLDLDASALRNKLIDADAAKRRAMTRLAELERETETLKRRCAELEHRIHGEGLRTTASMMTDSLQSLGMSQRILSLAVPQIKYKGRSVLWKT